MEKVILITGASSGIGALSARALAVADHVVYATMSNTQTRNAPQVEAVKEFAREHKVALRSVELDVTSQDSVDKAVDSIVREQGRLDVVIHNAGHMAFGPAEAFAPEQFLTLYDINVVGTQRVNRAALPHLRAQGRGLLVWVGSTSTRGGTPPYVAPYFAAKAAMDSLAVSYAGELSRFGIETSIIVPGVFPSGTNHFPNATKPQDGVRLAAYDEGPYTGVSDTIMKGLMAMVPPDADVTEVAKAIVHVVGMPFGKRPFRVYIDPSQDGAEVVGGVADRVRVEYLRNIDLADLLTPRLPQSR